MKTRQQTKGFKFNFYIPKRMKQYGAGEHTKLNSNTNQSRVKQVRIGALLYECTEDDEPPWAGSILVPQDLS